MEVHPCCSMYQCSLFFIVEYSCTTRITTLCLSIHQLMDIWVVFIFWLLLIMLLWTFKYRSLHGHMFLFLLGIYLGKELLALTVTFEELPNCFPKLQHHFTFPPAMYGFQFLHILFNTCYYLSFWHSHPSGGEVVSHCSFDFHFLMNNEDRKSVV